MGSEFNVTRAGIHADGLLKDERIYNIFDTAKLLNRPARVLVDAHSGLAGIAHWMNGYYQLTGEKAVSKSSPLVAAIKSEVDAQYVAGRTTTMGDHELDEICLHCREALHLA